ncbi:hypothetical protein CAPTEDRAFT_219441 [Capitella teleta]|uniref:Mesoderm induction early response protein 1 n=1 Tax=Capitella teleta TaxID=283909 RepID=R7VGZ9_CAPTE|nr:hypothetical protein CAPTEDRAFT_219441 [Capitella teleta]|eukprot:ELU18108.1 hypothetical protein CAPTEDRAFT_219441 [Capitella teleta]
MAEPTMAGDSSPDTDRDFDPSADMMVHDFDDEHTLDEEEALSGSDSCGSELDSLQKEGDMPMEQLLAMYRYGNPPSTDLNDSLPASETGETQDNRSSSEEEILSNQDLTLDKDEIAQTLLREHEDADQETTVKDLIDSVDMSSNTVRLLRSSSQPGSSDDDSEDIDYEPAKEDWKKTIQVGTAYQAVVPQGLSPYGDAPAYENDDRLLWDPLVLQDKEVEEYLNQVQQQNQLTAQGVQAIPTGTHIRDDEQALFLLLQCGHNSEEALRRRKMQPTSNTDPMSLWSEEECRNFESGLRHYGKDFFLVQQNKVRTRSVGELVQFYYLWKKTDRHDVFANKNRLEKKKYALHPGVTDYMDRFLDEQDSSAQLPRERSSSPSIHSLLYGDPKRQTPNELKPTSEDIAAALEMVQKVVNTDPQFAPLKIMERSSEALASAPSSVERPSLKRPASSEESDFSSPSKVRLKSGDAGKQWAQNFHNESTEEFRIKSL